MVMQSVQPIGKMNAESLIPFEIALKIADTAVFAQTARHLKNIEVAVLRGALQGHKYDQIAQEYSYAPEYIKHDVGPKLWQILSSSLGEKVSKTNLMAVLAQRADWVGRGVQDRERIQEKIVQEGSKEAEAIQQEKNFKSFSLGACRTIHLKSLEPPVGVLPLDSALYVERPPVEAQCYEAVMRSGTLIRIYAPSQMGKTSLMIRILAHAKQQDANVQTVALNLQKTEKTIFTNSDRFLRWFCAAVTRKLQLPHQVERYWNNTFNSQENCTSYFENCILPEINGVLVLALDQVDEISRHPQIADDFFPLLRSWYESRGNPQWKKLRSIVIHSSEDSVLLDINKSLLNVGLAIELKEFTANQLFNLAQNYALNLANTELSKLMQLVAGHPFLVQQVFYYLVTQNITLESLQVNIKRVYKE
ncbi:AAA-like domain-containing protein [Aerosakkonemataceae cyanobacterium BLCC-F50]|uniref:AAA-like domain-containing protein n=1 Tax=Floridaenema flaviceps BLCC-F50 TaxID=3153642 RepID=A0ABV4Y399_9CYAN